MKRFLAGLLVAVLLAGMMSAAVAESTKTATVKGGWLRMRASASFSAETIASYNHKLYTDPVTDTHNRQYYEEQLSGLTGYILAVKGIFIRNAGSSGGYLHAVAAAADTRIHACSV